MLTLPERRFALWNWTARTFSISVAERIISERFLSREPLRRFCGQGEADVPQTRSAALLLWGVEGSVARMRHCAWNGDVSARVVMLKC